MKKILSLLTVLCLLVGMSACTIGEKPTEPEIMETDLQDTVPPEFLIEVTEPPADRNEEERYQEVLRRLESYLDDGRKTVTLREDDGKYLMETLTSLGDYKDSKQILARLSVCPDQLIYTKETGWDRLGNEKGISTGHNYYDGAGRVIQTDDTEISYQLGIMRTSQDVLYISYLDNGQIEDVELIYFGEVKLRGTPVYDENGRLIQMNLMCNDGDFVSTFTYDSENRLIGVDMPDEWYRHAYRWKLSYEYDEAGNLILRTLHEQSWEKITYRSNYFYEDGKLIRKEAVRTSASNDTITMVTEYSYGADGRISGYRFTTDDPYETYNTTECVYTYGDSYSYTQED